MKERLDPEDVMVITQMVEFFGLDVENRHFQQDDAVFSLHLCLQAFYRHVLRGEETVGRAFLCVFE
jgi:hypothetical protein